MGLTAALAALLKRFLGAEAESADSPDDDAAAEEDDELDDEEAEEEGD